MDVLSASPVQPTQRVPEQAARVRKTTNGKQEGAFDQEMLTVNGQAAANAGANAALGQGGIPAELLKNGATQPQIQNALQDQTQMTDAQKAALDSMLKGQADPLQTGALQGQSLDDLATPMAQLGAQVEGVKTFDGEQSKKTDGKQSLSSQDFVGLLNQAKPGQTSPDASKAAASARAVTERTDMNSLGDLGTVPRSFGEMQGMQNRPRGMADRIEPQTLSIVNSQMTRNPGMDTSAMTAKPPVEVTGHVVQGAMASDRLSHESLNGISKNLQEMKDFGGGEIRMRLKPEALGELRLTVTTVGDQVGVKVQASNPVAKAILEESIGHLKDTLLKQNLNLGRVDVSVNSVLSVGDSANTDLGQQMQQQAQQDSGQLFERYREQMEGGQDSHPRSAGLKTEETEVNGVPRGRATAMAQPSANFVGDGRLDIRA
jgi:flagellar hook-length control protein FliK